MSYTQPASPLRPHGLEEEPSDSTTRRLHSLLPESWQRGFPRAGLFKALSDGAVCMAALAMPHHAPRFLRLGAAQTSHNYGPGSEYRVHVIDMWATAGGTPSAAEEDTNEGNSSKSSNSSGPATQYDDVLVFVHGGAWGSGKPWMYRLTAAGLAQRLRARYAVIVQYPVYPASSILEQRDCVCAALRFLRSGTWLAQEGVVVRAQTNSGAGGSQAQKRGVGRLLLAGHSSGANICALALLQAAQAGRRVADIFISLSGVFDVEAHYAWERSRGVHLLSPMGAAAGHESRHWECSPTLLLQRSPAPPPGSASGSGGNVRAFFPTTLLLHGTQDTTVPVTSSHDMAAQLARHQVRCVTAFPEVAHVHPVLELMQEWREGYPASASGGPCCDALLLWHQRLLCRSSGVQFQAKL